MKVVVVLIVLLGVAIAGIYFFGGYRTMDPDKQGTAAKAAITPGMSWKKVLDVAGENPKYRSISLVKEKKGFEHETMGPEVEFNRSRLASRINNGEVPQGFMFVYRYSERVAFAVRFDGNGKVTDVQDVMTMADLLQTR